MTRITAMILLAFLAACGADGEPETPGDKPANGVTVSGEATFGVSF
ncbi:argininosuccinate lyase [Thalassovita taeanensis]|uniref:Argininosuccinate lyase n=1 Tax=Thalassovita taeanensis TaxID=657014 RepID=A0A1H9AQ27_9RHOB|nr:argininosuccinate lyase [Thalassovita taeanensis]SEP78655.1 hypothetical protein SAMN04488092_102218 [Thalassovita taeanensis]